jgi:polysaccharide export outer membrane protein
MSKRCLILLGGIAWVLLPAGRGWAQESSNLPAIVVNTPAEETAPDTAPSTAATATNTPVVYTAPVAPPESPATSVPAVATNVPAVSAPATALPVPPSTDAVIAAPPAESAPLPTPEPGVEPTVHLLVPDDLVEIKVYQQPDLETKARIDRDGTVTMPLLGSVRISGKTDEQARALIHDLLARDYLVNPQVSVTVVEYAKRSFTILGEVQRPGTYEIPSGESITLLQAIAFAGGYTRIGSPGKVIVQRIEDGQKKIYNLDAGAMAKEEKVKPFEVLPDDSITVGEKFF